MGDRRTSSTKAICACVAELFVGLVAPVEGAPQLAHNAQCAMHGARAAWTVGGLRVEMSNRDKTKDSS
jgi:hypothetical protein